jgi:hypothetical protein
MRRTKPSFLILIGLLVIIGIIVVNALNNNGNEVHISTERDAFLPVNSVEEINGETYLIIGITPAPFPEEAKAIYRSAKKGKTVFVTITGISPEVKFVIKGGLNKDGNMRIKCESREEAKTLSSQLGTLWLL